MSWENQEVALEKSRDIHIITIKYLLNISDTLNRNLI